MFRIVSAIFVLGITVLIWGCSEEKKELVTGPPPEPPPLPVEVITVNETDVPIWIEYTGKTEATKRVDVRARVSGRLENALFQEGDQVDQGTVLFIIERERYEAALTQARARLKKDLATLDLARKDVERYRPLVAEDLAPRVTLEQYEAKVAELEAVILSDEAAIRDAELDLSYTEVKAPISGRVGRRLIDIGNIVGYGEQTVLTTIVMDDPMYAYFNPTETQFQIMRTHKSQDMMDARVTIPGNVEGLLEREPLTGKVDFADNRIDRTTGTITMRAAVANPDHQILEGTFVYVEVMVTDRASFLLVPPGIVQEDQRGSYVWAVDAEQKAQRVDIVPGFESRHYLTVRGGLTGGERVLLSGFAKVQPGTKLEVSDVTDTRGVLAQLAEKGMLPDKE